MKIATLIAASSSLLLFTSFLAAAYDLPEDIPARKPGLWEMRTTGTVGPNKVKDIKRYCLDASADLALQELNIMRKELEVVYNDISCQAPRIALAGRVLAGQMACRTNSPDDDEAAGKDFRWTTTFKSDSEVVNEARGVPHGVTLLLEDNLVEVQRRIGECPADQKPGGGLNLGFNYNSDAWPNESKPINIYESLKVVEKMLKEGIEINRRLGSM